MSYLSEKTGRPKQEGGHKRVNISVDKFVAEALEKVDNKSQFLEKVARPVLEQLDPGEASVFLWQIDVYVSHGIIKAVKQKDFKQTQALGWLADQLEDARKLCGIPEIQPSNIQEPNLSREDLEFWTLAQFTMTWKERQELRKKLLEKAYGKACLP